MFICIILFYIFCVRSHNLPVEENLETYINALKRVSQFYKKNRDLISVNTLFALFITNVNIKHVLDYNKDNAFLLQKTSLKENMKFIFQSNNKLIKKFRKTAKKRVPYEHRAILTLLGNMSTVTKRLYKFTYTKQYNFSEYSKKTLFYYWYPYKKKVRNLEMGIPNPYLSNACLTSLSEYPMNMNKEILSCSLNNTCNLALKNGTDIGYALSHRILWLVMARLGRGCTILSSQEDKNLTDKFCALAFTEATFNALYRYDLSDLVQEFICTCALGGHAEFLDKNWLNVTLKLQTFLGCFHTPGELIGSDESTGAIDMCDHHSTSVSVCSIAVAARFIIEKYQSYSFE